MSKYKFAILNKLKFVSCLYIIFSALPVEAQVPTNGLVAWYPLTQDHKDISGNGYHLLDSANVNSTILPENNRFGKQSKAFHHLGASGYGWPLKLDGFAPLNADFTLAFWTNVVLSEEANTGLWLLGLHSPEMNIPWDEGVFIGITSRNEWGLMPIRYQEHEITYFTSQFYGMETQLPSAKWVGISKQDNAQQTSGWHHVALVCQNKILQFYIDGIPVSTAQGNILGRFMNAPLQEINLYREAYYADFMLYNRSMLSSEINQLFSNQLLADLPLESISDLSLNCSDTMAHLSINTPQPLGWIGVRDVLFESARIEMSLSNDAGWQGGYWGWAMDTIAVNVWNQNQYFELPMSQNTISSNLSSLTKGTTYFVRSYFRNNDQFLWGDSLTFTTDSFTPGAGVTDFDGNQYPTMIYGHDEWMIRDLITTHFNDGTPIDKLYCNDDNDCEIYRWIENSKLGKPTCVSVPGREDVLLYDMNVVSCTGDVCPIGWHISTGEDWLNLLNALKLEPSVVSLEYYNPFNSDLSPLLSSGSNPYQFSLNTYKLDGYALKSYYPNRLFEWPVISGYLWQFESGYWLDNWVLGIESIYSSGSNLLNSFEQVYIPNSPGNGYPIRCVKNRSDAPIPAITLTHFGCSNPEACNFTCGVATNFAENCLIENQSCDDSSAVSINDVVKDCQCSGDFGVLPHDTIFDFEGNPYATIQIGNQVWMQQNLRTSYFNNGEYVMSFPSNPILTPDKIKYPENVADFERYGFYYDQSVLLDNRNICPVGWRLPSNEDWVTLFTFLQPNTLDQGYWPVARFLKSNQSNNDYWNEYAVNSAQMNIVPNGQYTSLSGSNNPGFIYWWYDTTLLQTEEGAWLWSGTESKMQWKSGSDFVTQVPYLEQDKLAIRCIKDN